MVNGVAQAFDMLLDLQRSLDRARSSSWPGLVTTGPGAFPPVNAFSENDAVVLVAEVPGVSKADINIEVRQDRIRISGKKAIEYGPNTSLHRRERRPGTFDRTFTIPFQIDPDGVKAQQENGILAIRLPRAEADKPRSITVE